MTPAQITEQLDAIPRDDDFSLSSNDLVESWRAAGVGLEVVEPVLQFMERNPDVDYGTPGPLVHYVEKFFKHGYEERLVASIRRKPTDLTIWMLNRIINGIKDPDARQALIDEMKHAREHALSDVTTVASIDEFLQMHSG